MRLTIELDNETARRLRDRYKVSSTQEALDRAIADLKRDLERDHMLATMFDEEQDKGDDQSRA